MTTNHSPTPWTVSYMVRERKGNYLAAVEDLEASHKAMRKALKALTALAYQHCMNCLPFVRLFEAQASDAIRDAQAALAPTEEEA